MSDRARKALASRSEPDESASMPLTEAGFHDEQETLDAINAKTLARRGARKAKLPSGSCAHDWRRMKGMD